MFKRRIIKAGCHQKAKRVCPLPAQLVSRIAGSEAGKMSAPSA